MFFKSRFWGARFWRGRFWGRLLVSLKKFRRTANDSDHSGTRQIME